MDRWLDDSRVARTSVLPYLLRHAPGLSLRLDGSKQVIREIIVLIRLTCPYHDICQVLELATSALERQGIMFAKKIFTGSWEAQTHGPLYYGTIALKTS